MKLVDYINQELPFKAWLDEYIIPSEARVIFDIGSCEAEDSIKLSRAYKNAKIYSFEPLPDNIKLCNKNINDYKAKKVELFPLALSDKKGQTAFYVSSGQPDVAREDTEWNYGNKSSSILPPAKTKDIHKWLKFNEEIDVKTERLDNFAKENNINQIDIIYMDVQGAELLVLEGAGKLLSSVRAIWLEVEAVELYKNQPLKDEVEKFMKNAGFTCVMNTVDKVSGDQLYINNTVVKEVENLKAKNPKEHVEKLLGILTYISSIWGKDYLSAHQKILLEDRSTEIVAEVRNTSTELSSAPPITVLLTVYNGERFLKQAVESILMQSYKDFEFLIINDGSSDESLRILRSFKDSRIRIINQANHGFIYSLNKGVELASGELIARMDQDDITKPKRLEKQLKLLQSNQRLGAVSTFFELIDFKKGKPLGTTMTFPINSIDIKRAMYLYNPMAHGSTTFRKEAWEQAGRYRTQYHPPEDYDLWRRIAKDWDLAIIPEVLFQYRINNPKSMSQMNVSAGETNFKKIQTEIIDGPFLRKSLYGLLRDYRQITEKRYGKHVAQVRQEYVSQQRSIASIFLEKYSSKNAFETTMFLVICQTSASKELLVHFIKVFITNVSRKLRIK